MNSTFSRSVSLLSMMLLSLAIMAAQPSARYSGVFDIRDAQVGEKKVTLTLDLRITNMSPAPITDGVLRFEDPLAPPALLGTLSGVTCESGESVTLEGTITIPLREYEHWRRGGLPRAFVGSGVAREHESSATTPPENRASSSVEIQQRSDAPATGSPAVFERVELRWDPREFEVAP